MTVCLCGHQPHQHGWVTYPTNRRPCDVCTVCGATKHDCCLTPKRCTCTDFHAQTTDLHDAAFRAGVWQVVEQRAKELKDQAKQELSALEPGDAVAGRWDGQTIAKATMTKGREKIVVTDDQALLAWVKREHPTEIVEAVNPAYIKTFQIVDGYAIDADGVVVPGVAVEQGEPYVSVRREKDAAFIVAQLLKAGQLSLDGVKGVEQ